MPAISRALDIGRAEAAAGREPFLYRDDLLEFDRGDLSRCTDGREPVRRTGDVPFACFGGLELTACLKVIVLQALSRCFLENSQPYFM